MSLNEAQVRVSFLYSPWSIAYELIATPFNLYYKIFFSITRTWAKPDTQTFWCEADNLALMISS